MTGRSMLRARVTWAAGFALLAPILALNVYDRLRLSFNGAYLDESDYLFVGRRLLAGATWPTKEYVFSSDIPLVVLGLGERVGGLVGARATSALLGLGSLAFYYDLVRRRSGDGVLAGLATLLVAVSAPHTLISKFATYDVACLMAFAAGCWALVRAEQSSGRVATGWALTASCGFALACLSKYVVVLELPLVGMYIVTQRKELVVSFAWPFLLIVGTYVSLHGPALKVLYTNQILVAHAPNATRADLSGIAFSYAGALVAVPLTVLLAGARLRGQASLRAASWCLAFAMPMVLYHLYAADQISLYKHTVYAIAALAPMTASAVRQVLRSRLLATPITLGIVGYALVCHEQLLSLERGFPDTRPVVAALSKTVGDDFCVLSENAFLFLYALGDRVDASRFYETGWFDPAHDGKHSSRELVDAVWDGKFEYVYLDGQITPALTRELRAGALHRHYARVFTKDYKVSGAMSGSRAGQMELYRRIGPYLGSWPLVDTEVHGVR
ncbi:MAG: Dolichyl-phosphate-mannose-protein mannosyltransferase [Pseudomonadota bacterium]